MHSQPTHVDPDLSLGGATFRRPLNWAIAMVLTGFYVVMYFAPQLFDGAVRAVDPLSFALRHRASDIYFFYSTLYTGLILVMGCRALAKYRHSRYQMVRTVVVMFSQTVFAFLIPSLLAALNEPEKYVNYFWPLSFKDLFPANADYLLSSEFKFGGFLLAWTVLLSLVAVPILTYFFGKRWYCSWVCGCGGLANTFGDPWRRLSNKKLWAWRLERFSIYGVLVLIIAGTLLAWISQITGGAFASAVDGFSFWYGLIIMNIFAGVVGTGFYPLLGTRIWCRFGCPQAAILGILQRFFSRFRITTNGGQCISCGNCSTSCEMGIDVKWYAQRGQNIVRASCVGCGLCSTVCPRGVLQLENGPRAGRIGKPLSFSIRDREMSGE